MSYLNVTQDLFPTFNQSQNDHLVDSVAGSLRMTLNSIAPLKKKIVKQRRLAPYTVTPKPTNLGKKSESKWHSTILDLCLVFKDSLKTYRKALCNARAAYYSLLL